MPAPQNKPEKNTAQQRRPSIHTMKSDAAEFLQKEKPSLAQFVGLTKHATTREPTSGKKKYVTISVAALVLILIATGAAFWFFVKSPIPEENIIPTQQSAEPRPFFAAEDEETIEADTADRQSFITRMETVVREHGRTGTIKYIKIKLQDGPQERFATLADLFALYEIAPPPNTFRTGELPVMVFLYYEEERNQFGFAAQTKDVDRTLRDFLIWEPSLATNLSTFFFGEPTDTAPNSLFEDRTYRNIDWRLLPLSEEKDIGVGHMIFPARRVFVVTTGKKAMGVAIDRLFGVQ